MAIVTYIPERKQAISAMVGVMRYCMQDGKTLDRQTGRQYVSGVNCLGENAIPEFMATKSAYGKTDGMNFYQYVQSFSPRENITHRQAHEIALEFAAKAWPGHEVLVCTHCDTAHVHSHFVINSVSFETGKKLRQNPNTLKELRALSDEICSALGFSVVIPRQKEAPEMSAREYRSAERGESWKLQLEVVIDRAMESAKSKEHFSRIMEWEGYAVHWSVDRKYITYTTPEGFKCRDKRLHEEKYQKENMEHEFRIREEICRRNAGGTARKAISGGSGGSRRSRNGQELGGSHRVPEDTDQNAGRYFGADGYSDYGQSSGGVYGSTVNDFTGGRASQQGSYGAVPADADLGSKEHGLADERPDDRIGETGWENERGIWESHLAGAGTDEAYFQEASLDFDDPQSNLTSLGIDAAYLAADLSRIIDDRPAEDCTTKHYQPERKKSHGQSMGM